MKKINEMQSERADKIVEMQTISAMDELNDEKRSEFDALEGAIKTLDSDIKRAEAQEDLNKTIIAAQTSAKIVDEERNIDIGTQFRDFLTKAIEKDGSKRFNLRAITTSTDTNIINKSSKSIDYKLSDGYKLLKDLGATFYTGLNGNFALPSMAESTAGFPGENTADASAGPEPASIVMQARRITHWHAITREFLAQTDPTVYATMVQSLVDGIWKAVAYDFFDTVDTDGASGAYNCPRVTTTLDNFATANFVSCEASLGARTDSDNLKYVIPPKLRADARTFSQIASVNALMVDNEILGYPVVTTSAANADRIIMGDFSKHAVGQWGGIEIIVDPYTYSSEGKIKVTALGLFDTASMNPRAFTGYDVSIA